VDEPRYKVGVADHEYGREQIKCQYACPVHTDARGYVRAIAAGNYEHAYLIARGPNPLASLCGRICGEPCEAACRRGTIDQPISIRALKRFVWEKFGSDARSDAGREQFPYLKNKTETRQCDDIEELSHLLDFLANAEFPKPTGERIAIIGSGPAQGRGTTWRTGQSFPVNSTYQNGQWNVIFELPDLSAGTTVAFAVWNGSQKDRDGRKYFSVWQVLE